MARKLLEPKYSYFASRILHCDTPGVVQEAIENAIPTVQAKLEQEYILRKASEGDQNGIDYAFAST